MQVFESAGKSLRFPIHIGVARDRHLASPAGVRIHRIAQLNERTLWSLGPPRLRYEEAAVDVACAASSDLGAIEVFARACQSRRTTAARMSAVLTARERVPRRKWLTSVLEDVSSGACSVLEHGYLTRVERAHGLPIAERQVRAVSTLGIVYRDAAYESLVIELDGRLFHDTARQRDRDMDRDLDALVGNQTTVRLSYGQVYDRACWTADRIAILLRQRGWRGSAVPCSLDCTVMRRLAVT